MLIRKATEMDVDAVAQIYSDVHAAEECGKLTIGWVRNVYPVYETATNAVANGEMYVMLDNNEIVAAAIINSLQLPAYSQCEWSIYAEDNEVCVLHTLVVDPAHGGKHYGSAFVRYYEEYAREHHFKVLRIDTQKINITARKMYARLGFREAGLVDCMFNNIPDIKLVCLEKALIPENIV